jgi:hypothetical protein
MYQCRPSKFVKIRDKHDRLRERNLEYLRFCRYFSLPFLGSIVRTETPVRAKDIRKRELARQSKNRERLSEQLTQRITHHCNEMTVYEDRLHTCMVFGELFTKNPELKTAALISKHQGLREALASEEVRRTLVKIAL